MDIMIINGPNLNLLGRRQPDIYGHETLSDIEDICRTEAEALGLAIGWFQSNHEGDLVTAIQEARDTARAIAINAAAYTHTSIALYDALSMFEGPKIEVHLSHVHKRETFRHHSMISGAVTGVIAGFGSGSYKLAIHALSDILKS